MDWAKAKTIIIIALLATNLILIVSYGILGDSAFQNHDEKFQADTTALLEKSNIYIMTEIPVKKEKMPVLFVEYDQSDQALLERTLQSQDTTIDGDRTKSEAKEQAQWLLEQMGWTGDNVVLSQISQEGNQYLLQYQNKIDGLLLEESRMALTVQNGKITNVDRSWLRPLGYGEGRKEIIPAVTALLKFISDKQPEERIEVEQIQLVYWLDTSGFGAETTISDTAFPAWKITYNQGMTKYVSAFQQ